MHGERDHWNIIHLASLLRCECVCVCVQCAFNLFIYTFAITWRASLFSDDFHSFNMQLIIRIDFANKNKHDLNFNSSLTKLHFRIEISRIQFIQRSFLRKHKIHFYREASRTYLTHLVCQSVVHVQMENKSNGIHREVSVNGKTYETCTQRTESTVWGKTCFGHCYFFDNGTILLSSFFETVNFPPTIKMM